MSASFGMESTFRGPLVHGYCDIVNLTVNKRVATANQRVATAWQKNEGCSFWSLTIAAPAAAPPYIRHIRHVGHGNLRNRLTLPKLSHLTTRRFDVGFK
jgi:hypothetical protein